MLTLVKDGELILSLGDGDEKAIVKDGYKLIEGYVEFREDEEEVVENKYNVPKAMWNKAHCIRKQAFVERYGKLKDMNGIISKEGTVSNDDWKTIAWNMACIIATNKYEVSKMPCNSN